MTAIGMTGAYLNFQKTGSSRANINHRRLSSSKQIDQVTKLQKMIAARQHGSKEHILPLEQLKRPSIDSDLPLRLPELKRGVKSHVNQNTKQKTKAQALHSKRMQQRKSIMIPSRLGGLIDASQIEEFKMDNLINLKAREPDSVSEKPEPRRNSFIPMKDDEKSDNLSQTIRKSGIIDILNQEILKREEDSNKRSGLSNSSEGQGGSFTKRKRRLPPRSLFIFSRDNFIRKRVLRLLEWKGFDYFILFVIFLNSLSLAVYDYSDRDSLTLRNQVIDQSGDVFTAIFLLECLLKIIGYGFVMHKHSYLRDGWNIIDFVVVVSGLLEVALGNGSVKLKSLRVLRVLRPLRSINAIKSMRKLVSALIQSLPDFLHVALFLMFIFILLAILGVHQYNGIFYNRCRLTPEPTNSTYWAVDPDETEPRVCSQTGLGAYICPNGLTCGNPMDYGISLSDDNVFTNPNINYGATTFDNLPTALVTVLVILFADGWGKIMYNLMDGDIPTLAAIYCLIIIVMGTFFLINLILAVIIQAFIGIQKAEIEKEIMNLDQEKNDELRKLNVYKEDSDDQDNLKALEDVEKPKSNDQKTPSRQQSQTQVNSKVAEISISNLESKNTLFRKGEKESVTFGHEHLEQKDDGTVEERVVDFSFLKKLNKQSKFLKMLLSKSPLVSQTQEETTTNVQDNTQQDIQRRSLALVVEEYEDEQSPNSAGLRQNPLIQPVVLVNQAPNSLSINEHIQVSAFGASQDQTNFEIQQIQESNITINDIPQYHQEDWFKEKKDTFDEKQEKVRQDNVWKQKINEDYLNDIEEEKKDSPFKKLSSNILKPNLLLNFSKHSSQKNGKTEPLHKKKQSINSVDQMLDQLSLHQQDLPQESIVEDQPSVAPSRLKMAYQNMMEQKEQEDNYSKDEYFNRVLQETKKDYKFKKNAMNDRGAIRSLATVRLGLKVKRQQGDISKDMERFRLEDRADSNKLYNFCFQLVEKQHFTNFISFCIVVNTVILATDRYPIQQSETAIIDKLNMGLSSVFILEMIIKLLALGVKAYFKDSFNIFDCIVVISNISDLFVHAFNQQESGGAITALRAFRLIRVFKLAKSWKKFSNLLKTIATTMVDISTFSVLLFLFMFTYSLLGMELFAFKTPEPNGPDVSISEVADRAVFNQFLSAFTTVFMVLTNDGWSNIYFKFWRINGVIATLFFITLIIIGQKVLLNLFLAILLENFDEQSLHAEIKVKLKNVKNVPMGKKCRRCCKQMCGKRFHKVRKSIKNSFKDDFENNAQSFKMSMNGSQRDFDEPNLSAKSMIGGKDEDPDAGSTPIQRRNKFALYDNTPKIYGISLGIMTQTNQLRKLCFAIVTYSKFDYIIIFFILVSGIQLALENPLNDPNGQYSRVLVLIDISTTVIFALEALMKIISFGFLINGSSSYLRNSWNALDFGIILFSVLGLTPLPDSLKIFKMFRVVRCLRLVSKNEGLQLAVKSLISAIPYIANVMLVNMIFFLIFGVIAISYFKGKFFVCNTEYLTFGSELQILNKWQCLNSGGVWKNSFNNFDNILQSLMTLFMISTTQAWPEIMNMSIDATDIDLAPKVDNNPYWTIFFITFIVIGTFFLLNLFVGVVISNFNRQKDKIGGNNLLTERQKEWIDTKLIALRAKPIKIVQPPENKFRSLCFKIQQHPWFDRFILGNIILNTVVLTIDWAGEPLVLNNYTDGLNQFFTGIFSLEAIIKIVGLGRQYFKDNWNIFDFVIVVGSIVSIFIDLNTTVSIAGATTIIRAFRISRIFRLVKRAKNLRLVFNTFVFTIPALANVGGLLLMLLYLYSIVGVLLFSEIKRNEDLSENKNFETFTRSFITLFTVATGDSWSTLLESISKDNSEDFHCIYNPSYQDYVDNGFQTVGCGLGLYTRIYFYSYILCVNIIFLNLFIAIILEGYEETQMKDNRLFNQQTQDHFRTVWAKYDPDATTYIKIKDLENLLFDLKAPLGWDESYRDDEAKQSKFIAGLDLPICNNFSDYRFPDVIESLAMRLVVHEMIEQEKEKKQKEKEEEDSLLNESQDPVENRSDNLSEFIPQGRGKKTEVIEDEEKMKDRIEKDLNKLEFSAGIKNVQAVKEMERGLKRINNNYGEMNQDHHFTSIHYAAAHAAVKHWKFIVAKNKLLRKMNENLKEHLKISTPPVNHEGTPVERATSISKRREEIMQSSSIRKQSLKRNQTGKFSLCIEQMRSNLPGRIVVEDWEVSSKDEEAKQQESSVSSSSSSNNQSSVSETLISNWNQSTQKKNSDVGESENPHEQNHSVFEERDGLSLRSDIEKKGVAPESISQTLHDHIYIINEQNHSLMPAVQEVRRRSSKKKSGGQTTKSRRTKKPGEVVTPGGLSSNWLGSSHKPEVSTFGQVSSSIQPDRGNHQPPEFVFLSASKYDGPFS